MPPSFGSGSNRKHSTPSTTCAAIRKAKFRSFWAVPLMMPMASVNAVPWPRKPTAKRRAVRAPAVVW